jgi:UDP-N-acetylglucosamine acyltransferase
MSALEERIHPTAVVSPEAQLADDVRVGPYCVIEAGARIASGCRFGPHVHVHGCVTIGADTAVGTSAVFGGEPQDVKYDGAPATVAIGARCRIYEHVTVHRGTGEDGHTSIGDDVMMMASSHVAHNATVEDGVVMVNGALVAGHGHIGTGAILSGNAAVHQFCRVGRLTMLGGACMATKDVPPFSIAVGSYPVRWRAPNRIGLRRAGFSSHQRDALRAAFSDLFLSGASPMRTAEELRAHDEPAVVELAEFILASKRGICTGPLRRGGALLEGDDAV